MKKIKKVPVQIYLEPEQDKIITLLAKEKGKSKAAIIRSCISDLISNLPPGKDPLLNIINLGASGQKDISEKHDEYLNKAQKGA